MNCMKNPFERLDLATLLIVAIFAVSLSLMNFRDLSWGTNGKSYIGFLVFFVLLLLRVARSNKKGA